MTPSWTIGAHGKPTPAASAGLCASGGSAPPTTRLVCAPVFFFLSFSAFFGNGLAGKYHDGSLGFFVSLFRLSLAFFLSFFLSFVRSRAVSPGNYHTHTCCLRSHRCALIALMPLGNTYEVTWADYDPCGFHMFDTELSSPPSPTANLFLIQIKWMPLLQADTTGYVGCFMNDATHPKDGPYALKPSKAVRYLAILHPTLTCNLTLLPCNLFPYLQL